MRCLAPLVVVLLISGILLAQEKPQAPAEQKSLAYVSPSARLAAAKTVFMKNNGGSEIPFNVISGGLEGWGRFLLVDSPEQADIVIAVTSPDDDHTSQTASKTKIGANGRMEDSASSSRNVYEGPIKLVVSDARLKPFKPWPITRASSPASNSLTRGVRDMLINASYEAASLRLLRT